MKTLLIILTLSLTSCAAQITIRWTDPETSIENTIEYTSARQAAITIDQSGVTVITGKVAISDETAQVLIREVRK